MRAAGVLTVLVVDVELAEVAGLGGAAVAVRERAQRLQALGHGGREAPLARQVRDQEDVLRRVHLVRPVRATWCHTLVTLCVRVALSQVRGSDKHCGTHLLFESLNGLMRHCSITNSQLVNLPNCWIALSADHGNSNVM